MRPRTLRLSRHREVSPFSQPFCAPAGPFLVVEVLPRVLLPEIQGFFERGEGPRELAGWKAQQKHDKVKRDETHTAGASVMMLPPCVYQSINTYICR